MSIEPNTPADAQALLDESPSSDFASAVAAEIEKLALAYADTPKGRVALAENLKDFIKTTFPAYVSTAYWVTLSHSRQQDKGIAVDIAQLPLGLRLRALVGGWSAGLGVFTRPFDIAQLHTRVAIGAGAVTPYADAGKLIPVVGFTVSF